MTRAILIFAVIGFFSGASASGWINIGPGGGGWVQSMTASRYDAERLWVGSDVAGVFRSDDGGRSYVTCNEGNENLFIECIAEHPENPDLLLIGTFGGIYKSTDRGRTWSLKRTGFPPCSPNRRTVIVSRIIWDAKGTVWASVGAPRYCNMGRGELYCSVDDGETWRNVVPPGAMDKAWAAMDMILVGDAILVSTPTNGVIRSEDGGRSWRPANAGLPHLRTRRFAQSSKNPDRIYLTLRGKPGETPWNSPPMRSDDGGRSWRPCGVKGLERQTGRTGARDMECSWYDRVAVAPDDPDTVYLAGGSWWCKGVWKSTDGGATWVRKFSGKENSGWLKNWNDAAQCLTVSPLPPYAVTFGTGCAVYRSTDGGETWGQRYTRENTDGSSRSAGLELTCMHSIQPSTGRKGRFYFNYFDVGVFRVDDYGKSFRQIMKGVPKYWDCFAVAEDPKDATHLYGAFGTWSRDSGFIGESTDGGDNWRLLDMATNSGWRCATPRSLALVGDRPPYMLAAQVSRRLLMLSDDGGRSWRQVTTNEFPEAESVSKVVAKDGRLYVGTSVDKTRLGAILTSADRGKTWRRLSEGAKLGTVMSIAVDGERIVAATRHGWNKSCGAGAGGVWYSPDGGGSWRLIYENGFCTDVAVSGENLVVSMTDHPYHDRCRGGGVVRSTDGGRTWRSLNDPTLSNRNIECLCVDPDDPEILIAGSGGNSAFIRRLPAEGDAVGGGGDPHAELLKFVGPEGLLHDYLGELPSPEDCAACRPNAKGWWTPIENGPMFTGPWLEACCARARRTGSDEDKALCRRLAGGLLKAASVSKVPGFIARGVGADGVCHYPVGSMDQTLPWFYGLWAYYRSGLASPEDAAKIRAKMLEVASAIEKNGWKCPCEPPFEKEHCGDFLHDGLPFRNAVHGLFLFRILAELEPARMDFYRKLLPERLPVCARGYAADLPKLKNLEPHLLWIYVCAQGCLAELARLEPDEPAFRQGLETNAERAKRFLPLSEKYDNSTESPFRYANWRTGYRWSRQKTIADSDRVSRTGDKSVLGSRKEFERDYMTAPLSAAAICAFAGAERESVAHALAHYDWSTLNLSEFFLSEVASTAARSDGVPIVSRPDAAVTVARYDVVIAGGTMQAVAAAERSRKEGKSVCVLAPRNYLGEDTAGNLTCVEAGLTPLDAKCSLDRRLLACGADFMTGVFVLSADGGEVRCASSGGEFSLRCGEFVDRRIGVSGAGFRRAARIVVSGTAPSAPGVTVLPLPGDYTTVVTNRVKEDGDGSVHVVSGRVWRCEFDLPFSVTDAFGMSAAELFAREKTWVPDLLDGADELIPLASKAPARPAVPASREADVVVVGGGVAGVPAAVAAARGGAKVILVESLRQLGGMGTAGGIGQYWQGRRDGLTAEYDRRIRGLSPSVHGVGKREAWRRMAQEAGVVVLWGCVSYGVEKTGSRITALKVASDYGPLRLTARTFVDASGNANVAAAAGAPVVFLEKGPLTLQGSGVAWRPLGVGFSNTDWGYVNDTSVRDLTRFLACGRAGAKGIWDVSQLVGSRERRRIVGEVVLTDTDMATGRKFSDVIVQTCSNFDSHGPTADDLGLLPEPGSWLIDGVVPYRALLPKGVDNLLMAGLGISATRDALPIVRMQSDVQNTGYAVGTAAALAAKRDGNCRTLDVRALQRKLVGERRLTGKALEWTDRTVSDEDLAAAVRSVADNYRGAALVLSERRRTIPLLKAAFAREDRIPAKFRLAHVLGVLGEPDGADLLADWIQGKIEVPEPDLAKRPSYARRFSYRQSVIIALGRTKSRRAVEILSGMARKLSFDESFFTHRAVCWASESCGNREVGEILRRRAAQYPSAIVRTEVRPMSGCSPKNHFMTSEEIAALKSLDIATAVCRLTGDDAFLRPWLGDVREICRLQAERVLHDCQGTEAASSDCLSDSCWK